jgi:hypothetical protein
MAFSDIIFMTCSVKTIQSYVMIILQYWIVLFIETLGMRNADQNSYLFCCCKISSLCLIPNKLRVGVELIRISSSIYFYFISNYCSELKKKVTMQLHLCAPQHLISICIFDYTYIFFLSVNKLKYILIKLFMICIGKFSSQFSCFSKYRLDLKFQVLLINHTTANYFSDGILINWYLL